jgi:bis(5'-nucleosyl)-tetraphosphatase (symmetrical)
MAVYAIGDVQGCFETLKRLVERIGFDPASDRIWLVGDLVNRGPKSLEVLRWARRLDDRVVAVLGNHDLHLIGRALGIRRAKPMDTLDAVLEASDREDLIDWLRQRPLLHRENGFVMVHAGLLPCWTIEEAASLAREVEAVLSGVSPRDVFEALTGKDKLRWREGLSRRQRIRIALKAFTTLRTCTREGRPCPGFSGPPEDAPHGCYPWFEIEGRKSAGATIVCGHWAALGLDLRPRLLSIDTGCVWGGSLTAVRLEDRAVFQQPLADPM